MIFLFNHKVAKVSEQVLHNIGLEECGKHSSNPSDTETLGGREQVTQNEVFIYHETEIIVPL